MEEKVLNGSISKEAQAAMIRKERTANNAWHKFCRNKSAVVGLIIISLMILMGVLAPVLSPTTPIRSTSCRPTCRPSPRGISWAPTTWGATSSAGSSTAPG